LYVIVTVFVSPSQLTSAPIFSATNLRGNIVLPLMISGTTFEFEESIITSAPFTFAVFLPIQSSIVLSLSVIFTFLCVLSHSTVPPSDSIIALIGKSVLPFFKIGGESRVFSLPFTVKADFPI